MRPIQVFFKDMKTLATKRMLLLSFLGVALLPMLYSSILIDGSMDPYGQTSKLPVAVVNLDKGADYEGKTMNVGEDFIEELKKSDNFKWDFVSEEKAKDGMEHNDYYMTITVPSNFSENAATLTQENPVQAELIFEPNSQYNFVAGQIGNSAMKELKSKLNSQITEAYTRSMFEQVGTISDGLGQAGEGATELKDGAGKLEDGLTTLKDNLNKLASGTTELSGGVSKLYNGAASLSQGTGQLSSGAAGLADGLGQLSAAEQQLYNGAAQSKAGAAQLAEGLKASKAGASELKQGLTASSAASGQVADGADQVAKGLEQLMAATPELQENESLKQLLAASKQVAAGSAQLRDGQEKLLTGSSKLAQGQDQLYAGAAQLSQGQEKLTAGLETFGGKLQEAGAGADQLASGAKAANSGAVQLKDGLGKLSGGVEGIADGSKQLDQGAGQLRDGSKQLVNGSGELATKLNDAAAETGSIKDGDDIVNMFAEPVVVKENTDHKLDHYGLGIAPYFLSLALFMGALVYTTVFSVRDSYTLGASPMGRFFSRTLTYVTISLLQSLIADAVLLYGLKIEVTSVPLFVIFTILTSFAYTFIIQALVTWLDNPGRFLVVLLMIFQLTSSAGTFPLELLPDWMQKLNPWLPMTHAITGFKTIIASGDYALMREQMLVLGAFAVVFLALTFLYFKRQAKNHVENMHPAA
ncbi:YhgE/Pip domain-containing protein [Paenibacillus glycanilyticus]|uniref:YhgE/Pip domain-containing protein n=1 Tax=Paenibacillus glycanilyticus TaxID=126569 RepID=UPI00203BCAA3|nr:YhgE/Pip domain-containing protein [Paenibacillus glycanilyticus]MCM3628743.1 YhgE/Pip domain-containing protein [Paenibacillus glycanilyticus]